MQKTLYRPDEGDEFLTAERCHILEVFNVADFAAYSIARARVEPGVDTQLHALRGIDETYYILSGEGKMEISEGDIKKVRPGDVVFIPRGSAQRITNTGKEDLLFLCICTPRFTGAAYQNLEA